jgi:hypothetical protein
MTLNYKVSYSFVSLPDTAIADFTDTIINSLTGNAGLPTTPVALPLLATQKTEYLVKLAATAQGGTLATAEKNAAREVLVGSLRQLAAYVQSMAGNDLTLLLSSGFQPTSTNRAQTPLPKPVVLGVENGVSGQLVMRVQPMANARAFEQQFKNGTGGWQPGGIATQARRIEVDNLTPGNTYMVQSRAIGGSTGYSEWSDPVSHIVV